MEAVLPIVGLVLNLAITLYIVLLLARLVLGYIPIFVRGWRPRGPMLVLAEIVYTLTDPPIRALRRVIPPLQLGPVALDLSFSVVLLACFVLLSLTRFLAV